MAHMTTRSRSRLRYERIDLGSDSLLGFSTGSNTKASGRTTSKNDEDMIRNVHRQPNLKGIQTVCYHESVLNYWLMRAVAACEETMVPTPVELVTMLGDSARRRSLHDMYTAKLTPLQGPSVS